MPLTREEEKAVRKLLEALVEWPCEPMADKPGGKHYTVDYTVARARKTFRAYEGAMKVFPQFEPDF